MTTAGRGRNILSAAFGPTGRVAVESTLLARARHPSDHRRKQKDHR